MLKATASQCERPKTVFVIGAGASKEAGLPTGTELKKSIATALDMGFDHGLVRGGDPTIVGALKLAVAAERGHFTPYLHAARQSCNAMPLAISIDNFIDAHQRDKKIKFCGKLAIVRTIYSRRKRTASCT